MKEKCKMMTGENVRDIKRDEELIPGEYDAQPNRCNYLDHS